MHQRYTDSACVGPSAADTAPDGPDATVIAVTGPANFRAEFGAYLEASYPPLVSQLCMITLDAGQAHHLVQDAYARAWQRWATVRELPDPAGWIRQLAMRTSGHRWRRLVLWLGRSRTGVTGSAGSRHVAVLKALGQLTPHRRRALVLFEVAHLPVLEIARMEDVTPSVAESRVVRARAEFSEALAARSATAAAGEEM